MWNVRLFILFFNSLYLNLYDDNIFVINFVCCIFLNSLISTKSLIGINPMEKILTKVIEKFKKVMKYHLKVKYNPCP